MGKKEKTIYTCDKCRKVIEDDVGLINIHYVRWYTPYHFKPEIYLCLDCMDRFKSWLIGPG